MGPTSLKPLSQPLLNAIELANRFVLWLTPYGALDPAKCVYRTPGKFASYHLHFLGPVSRALYQITVLDNGDIQLTTTIFNYGNTPAKDATMYISAYSALGGMPPRKMGILPLLAPKDYIQLTNILDHNRIPMALRNAVCSFVIVLEFAHVFDERGFLGYCQTGDMGTKTFMPICPPGLLEQAVHDLYPM